MLLLQLLLLLLFLFLQSVDDCCRRVVVVASLSLLQQVWFARWRENAFRRKKKNQQQRHQRRWWKRQRLSPLRRQQKIPLSLTSRSFKRGWSVSNVYHVSTTTMDATTIWLWIKVSILTKKICSFCMLWSSWIQTCKTGDQPYSDTSPSGECSLNVPTTRLCYMDLLRAKALLWTFIPSKSLRWMWQGAMDQCALQLASRGLCINGK